MDDEPKSIAVPVVTTYRLHELLLRYEHFSRIAPDGVLKERCAEVAGVIAELIAVRLMDDEEKNE